MDDAATRASISSSILTSLFRSDSFARTGNTTEQRSPILTEGGGTLGVGSTYLRIGVLLLGISNYQSSHTLIVGRLMGKYSRYKKTPVKTEV